VIHRVNPRQIRINTAIDRHDAHAAFAARACTTRRLTAVSAGEK
jgi:hypothetical protein